jgi:type I site-specific restriction-modification system R (restriction) subunit
VQTLSRLNRAHPKKHDVFVLDFMNDAEMIQAAFAPYYRTTILAEETGTAKIEHDKALSRVMLELLKDDTEVYKQFVQNESFRRFITDMVYQMSTE